MRISTNSFSDNFMLEVNQLETQQNNLQAESASGLKLTLPEDNPEGMDQVLNLQSEASANTQFQTNIAQLQSSATTVSTALNGVQTLVNRAGEIATLADSVTSPQQFAAYATEVGGLLQQAVDLGNTKDSQGDYLFGGTQTGKPPFVATTNAAGNITGVTYQGNTSLSQVEIAPNNTATAQVPGANTTGAGPRGVFTDTGSGADLFNHLISLQTDLSAGNATAISTTDAPQLTNDENNLLYQITANGVLQSRLTNTNNVATQQNSNMTQQISLATNADLAQTLTQLSQTQTAYQAALESGTQVFNLSLLNYIQ